jgi:hypothetical protein
MTIFLPVVECQKLTARFSRRLTAVVLIEFFQPSGDESRTLLIFTLYCSVGTRVRHSDPGQIRLSCESRCLIAVETDGRVTFHYWW